MHGKHGGMEMTQETAPQNMGQRRRGRKCNWAFVIDIGALRDPTTPAPTRESRARCLIWSEQLRGTQPSVIADGCQITSQAPSPLVENIPSPVDIVVVVVVDVVDGCSHGAIERPMVMSSSCAPIFARQVPHTRLLRTSMSPLRRLLLRGPIRAFHSPFVALSASSRLTTPSSSATAPIYEKQHDTSPEPHLSSSGTRTYVVSEPDPSNTPYEVPSGAYPTSAPYVSFASSTTPNPEARHSSTNASLLHSYNTRTVGESAAVRNTEVPGEMSHRGGSHGGVGLMDAASTKPGKF